MNEILAVVVFVCFSELASPFVLSQVSGKNEREMGLYTKLNDPNEVEADIYSVFSKLMSKLQEFYMNNGDFAVKKGTSKANPFNWDAKYNDASNRSLPVVAKAFFIFDKILAGSDAELYDALSKFKIQPQMFFM